MNSKYAQIFRNSFFMYTRHFIILISGLASTRLLLSGLGVDDYGLFLSIWSFVFLFSFIAGTTSSTVLRYFAHDIEQKSQESIRNLLASSIVIILIVSLIFVGFFTTLGPIIFELINSESLDSKINTFSILMLILVVLINGMFSTIFSAVLLAFENFKSYTKISLIEVLLKLFCAATVVYFENHKIFYYSLMLAIVSSIICYLYYAKMRQLQPELYVELKAVSSTTIRGLSAYAGWTLFGQLTSSLRMHGLTVVISGLFAPEIVVARAISVQVTNSIVTFGNNFSKSSYPKIIKSWSALNKIEMHELVNFSTVITFGLIWALSFPLIVFTREILDLWLILPPELTIKFVKVVTLEATITAIALPVMAAARAPGKIKGFELVLGLLQIIAFVFICVSVLNYRDPVIVPFGVLMLTIIMFPVRLYLTSKLTSLSILSYLRNALFPILLVLLSSVILYFLYSFIVESSGVQKLSVMIINVFLTASIIVWTVKDKIWPKI